MRLHAMTDKALSQTVGSRIQALRLKKNISLELVAKDSGVSRQTLYLLLNQGKGTLETLIAVLRTIGELERISSLVEEVLPSPLQIALMEGKKRQRASRNRSVKSSQGGQIFKPSKSTDW